MNIKKEWVYDRHNKKFTYDFPNDDNFIELSTDTLIKAGKRNMEETTKYINSNKLNNSLLHFTTSNINDISDIFESSSGSWDEKESSIYYNPNGLWCSIGDSWLQYVKTHIKKPSQWNLFSNIYKIEVNQTVLVINSLDELYNFIEKFKHDDQNIQIYNMINWDKVRKKYNGLIVLDPENLNWQPIRSDRMIITGSKSVQLFVENLFGKTKWQTNRILLIEWIRHWETQSGVIWHPAGISDIKLIKKIKFEAESEHNDIYFVRHGETKWNKLGLGQGAENDIELNDTGREQARKLGLYLKNHRLDKPFDIIISSPLKRALETAHIVAKIIDFDINNIIIVDDIIENKSGLLTPGKTDKEMRADPFYKDFYNEMDEYYSFDKIKQNELDELYPSDKIAKKYQMETLAELKSRLVNFINMLNKYKSKKILVVSHNGTIIWLNKLLLNTSDIIKGDLSKGKNCHITYYKNNNNKWKLIMAPTTFYL